MGKHHDQNVFDRAEHMYLNKRRSITAIADSLGVPWETVNDWRNNNDWEERRERRYQDRTGQDKQLDRLKTILLQKVLTAVDEDNVDKLDSKTLNALCRVIGTLSPPASIQLKQMERNEAKARECTVEERMAQVHALLGEAGFSIQDEDDEV